MNETNGLEYQASYEPNMERMVQALKTLLEYHPGPEVIPSDNFQHDKKTA